MKVWRVLKNNNMKPYKTHISHCLRQGDQERRLQFCTWLRQQIDRNNNFLNEIIWSDESKFTNCGIFNRNTDHIWAVENPRINRPIRAQVRFGLNVWAGIYGDRIIGPFIYQENLNGASYLEFLRTTFSDYLDELPLNRLPNLWFQQDGAPPHNTRDVREFLHQQFPEKWIGNRGAVEWPARSPDLSPLDYYLWGHLKNKIYKTVPNDVAELRANIVNGFNSLRRRDIQRAVQNIRRRIDLCRNVNGNLFEYLL